MYLLVTAMVCRCVAEEQRTFALGIQSFCFRVIGNIPGPIVLGAVFDLACIYFRYDVPCMSRGNCWVYNNYQLSWSVMAIASIGICLNFVFSFLSWLTYPKQNAHNHNQETMTNQTPLELAPSEVPLEDVGEKEKKFEAMDSSSNLIPESN